MTFWDRIRNRPGRGWKPNRLDKRDSVYRHYGDGAELPASASVEEFEPHIWNQSSTSSCVAQAEVAAIMVELAQHGVSAGTLSRLFAYYNSRKAHFAAWLDAGTRIRDCAKQIQKVGLCDESAWPWDVSRVNERPDWLAYSASALLWGFDYYKIDQTGDARVLAVKAAIAAGHAVVFGTIVPKDWTGGRAPDMCAGPENYTKFAGGHAMVLTSYQDKWFGCRNSWGKGFADNGRIALREDWIKWDKSRDFTVFVWRS